MFLQQASYTPSFGGLGLRTDNSTVELFIEDDGAGFEPGTMFATTKTVGLPGMRERVELLAARPRII